MPPPRKLPLVKAVGAAAAAVGAISAPHVHPFSALATLYPALHIFSYIPLDWVSIVLLPSIGLISFLLLYFIYVTVIRPAQEMNKWLERVYGVMDWAWNHTVERMPDGLMMKTWRTLTWSSAPEPEPTHWLWIVVPLLFILILMWSVALYWIKKLRRLSEVEAAAEVAAMASTIANRQSIQSIQSSSPIPARIPPPFPVLVVPIVPAAAVAPIPAAAVPAEPLPPPCLCRPKAGHRSRCKSRCPCDAYGGCSDACSCEDGDNCKLNSNRSQRDRAAEILARLNRRINALPL